MYDEVCAPRHPEKKMTKLFRRSAQALFCQIFANIPGKEFDASLGTAAVPLQALRAQNVKNRYGSDGQTPGEPVIPAKYLKL